MTREEAIEVYNGLINTKIKEAFEFFTPELRESEDKRITRAINNMLPFIPDEAYANNGVTKEDVLAWLEKQKECVADSSKTSAGEDERIRRVMLEHFKSKTKETWCGLPVVDIIAYLEKQKGLTTENNMISSKKCNKSPLTDEAFKEQLERVLRDNVLDTDIRITGDTVIGAKLKEYFEQKEQKPAELSEDDEKLLDFWLDVIDRNDWRMDENFCKASREFINRLKSLSPSWKPSEEQMKTLRNAIALAAGNKVLAGLYEQLKKLM